MVARVSRNFRVLSDRRASVQGAARFQVRSALSVLLFVAGFLVFSTWKVLQAQFPPVALLDRDSNLGRKYTAPWGVRELGQSLAFAGDVDGDGSPDLLVGAPGGLEGFSGRAFLVPGTRGGPLERELSGGDLGVVEIRSGSSSIDRLGYAVAGAGDVDGDGFADLLIAGGPGCVSDVPHGGVFLVFGASGLPSRLDLSRELGTRARFFYAAVANGTGDFSAAAAGDFDGDGYADFAIGSRGSARGAGGGGRGPRGAVWIVRGGPGLRNLPAISSLGSLTAPVCVYVPGVEEESQFGASVAGAGDLDGDRLADLAIGAPRQGSGGSVFIVFGTRSPPETLDLSSAEAGAVVELRGAVEGARLGEALGGPGVPAGGIGGLDATGDGIPDLIVGAPGGRSWFEGPAGACYLVAGGAALRASRVQSLPSSAFLTVRGVLSSGFGTAIALVPDCDGDGVGDVLVGAPGISGGIGSAYFVRGGGDVGREILVERLTPEEGSIFLTAGGGAGLGAAVAGLPDRNGDLLGELVIGAPGLARGGGRGVAFEVFRPQDPESPAPRNLSARVLPGGRVQLSWLVSRRHSFLRVYRDGRAVSPKLPGFVLSYVDLDPDPGKHVYFVEADGSESQRSPPIEIEVGTIPVQDLTCTQIEGERKVRVTWRTVDRYSAFRIRVDDEPFGDLLPPDSTETTLELSPGEHRIEVRDSSGGPGSSRATCTVYVVDPVLPGIEGLACSVSGPRTVRLTWIPAEPYDSYLVYRDGVFIAKVSGGEYLDEGAPPGELSYEVRGLQADVHRGPAARCRVQVEPSGVAFVRGTVSWASGGRLRKGFVSVFEDAGREVTRAQLSSAGEFRAEVPGPGSYLVRVQVALDLSRQSCAPPGEFARQAVSAEARVSTEAPASIELPPPVLLVTTLGESSSREATASRWLPLRTRIGSRAFLFPISVRGGIAEATIALDRCAGEIASALKSELGAEPPGFDVAAHGGAGLAARAWAASLARESVRKLILLGTPNLGTARAKPEARAESSTRPPRFVRPHGGGASERGREEPEFSGAVEETTEFARYLEEVLVVKGAREVHCVAGTGGLRALDSVLGCEAHDDRVCAGSALGVDGAIPHTVPENHETLGRGSGSVELLAELLLGSEAGGGGTALEGGAGAGEVPEIGSGGSFEPSYATSNVYAGILEPGGLGELPLISDTSESMIVILNSGEPGGIQFQVRTPSGRTVGPADGGDPAIDYYSFGDGEGHDVQAYWFSPCEEGVYVAVLANPEGEDAVLYTLEAYLASDFTMQVRVDPVDVQPSEGTRVLATLTRRGTPELGATVTVRVTRPDGGLVLLDALDDGQGADELAFDGVYSAAVPGSSLSGLHQVEVHANEEDPLLSRFQREAVTWYRVWSDAARFTGEFASGTSDSESDGYFDFLWIDVGVETTERGTFFASGTLADRTGTQVAAAMTAFSLEAGVRATFRLYFSGAEIRAARKDGPFVLSELWLYDGTAGFVPADHRAAAHSTIEFRWEDFGTPAGAPYLRGDSNGDGSVDISDGIFVLCALFAGDPMPACLAALDANDDGKIDIADPIFLFQYLFAGGVRLPPPFPACGTGGELPCPAHPACSG